MKKLLIFLFVLTLSVSAASASAFPDVTANTDYKFAIQWLNKQDIVEGYPDGSFQPDKCVNRAEFLKMLYLTTDENLSAKTLKEFSDINTKAWYYPYLATGVNQGIVAGYPDGTFRPANCINRVEAIKIITLKFEKNSPSEDLRFVADSIADLDSNAWYYPTTYNAISRNLVGLNHTELTNSGLKFYPADSMTRKEVAEVLYRFTGESNRTDYSIAKETFTHCEDEEATKCYEVDFELVFKNPVLTEGTEGDVSGLLYLRYFKNGTEQDAVLMNAANNTFLGDGGQPSKYKYEYFTISNPEMHQTEFIQLYGAYNVKIQDRTFTFQILNSNKAIDFFQ